MEEMELGPNGGLIFCMELLLENKGNVINKKGLSCRSDLKISKFRVGSNFQKTVFGPNRLRTNLFGT